MAKQDINNLKKIFLSASIPSPERDRKFYDTADIIAIRDAVKALATVLIPKAHLIWGGHPAITPLIRLVMERMGTSLKDHITLYQSNFFRSFFPADNFFFENIKVVPENVDRDTSLVDMRNAMINDHDYHVGIFIGGMDGVIDEYNQFKLAHPKALILPVASTGAAADIIYKQAKVNLDSRLLDDYAYMALFRDLLKNYI